MLDKAGHRWIVNRIVEVSLLTDNFATMTAYVDDESQDGGVDEKYK